MDFSKALDWLAGRPLSSGHYGLHRMEFLMDHLDQPQNQFPAVLIGGTNGKGSVTAMLEHVFSATSDYQVGSTISPHLVHVTERIRLQCRPIPAALWLQGTEALQQACKVMEKDSTLGSPSFFELITALAFYAFREGDLDLALVEVGLGGRLDATNVCHPEVSVITNIGTDHKEILGPDRPSIAREKLGILRPKRPLVTAERDPEILAIFRDACEKSKSHLLLAHPKDHFQVLESTSRGHRLRIPAGGGEVWLPLPGLHQLDNLAIVLEVIKRLVKDGFDVPPEAVAKGISGVSWPGRLQWLPGNPPILTDGAHNSEGLASLLGFLDRFPMERPCHLVFGALKKKPFVEMSQGLARHADSLAFVPPTCSRAVEKTEFEEQIAPLDSRWKWHDSLASALDAGSGARSILVAGSLYLIADLLRLRPTPDGV